MQRYHIAMAAATRRTGSRRGRAYEQRLVDLQHAHGLVNSDSFHWPASAWME
ncbi:MAG: hypothetical protein HYV63_17185 [Candidatus Schekmanbacteria bacterium]|nr:hypothetical protein [Candidatus Schekmanbacteria bacterium]